MSSCGSSRHGSGNQWPVQQIAGIHTNRISDAVQAHLRNPAGQESRFEDAESGEQDKTPWG